MRITTFNPQIMTSNADELVALFEELGFEKRHTKTSIGDLNVTGIRMKDDNGNHLDISEADVFPERDLMSIRMNVDDFDEVYQLLLDRGFKNVYGGRTVENESSRSAVMVSESGIAINLVQHIRK